MAIRLGIKRALELWLLALRLVFSHHHLKVGFGRPNPILGVS